MSNFTEFEASALSGFGGGKRETALVVEGPGVIVLITRGSVHIVNETADPIGATAIRREYRKPLNSSPEKLALAKASAQTAITAAMTFLKDYTGPGTPAGGTATPTSTPAATPAPMPDEKKEMTDGSPKLELRPTVAAGGSDPAGAGVLPPVPPAA